MGVKMYSIAGTRIRQTMQFPSHPEILSITGITIAETGIYGKWARFGMTVPKGCYRYATQAGVPS
jgi:hypothetical protein